MYDASCQHIHAKVNVWYKEKLGMPFAFSLVKTEAPTYVNTLEHRLPAPFVKKIYNYEIICTNQTNFYFDQIHNE